MGIEIAEKRGITPKEYRASIAGLDEMDFMAEVKGRTFLTLFRGASSQGSVAPKKKLAECKGFSIDVDFSELDKVGLKDIEKDTHQLVIA